MTYNRSLKVQPQVHLRRQRDRRRCSRRSRRRPAEARRSPASGATPSTASTSPSRAGEAITDRPDVRPVPAQRPPVHGRRHQEHDEQPRRDQGAEDPRLRLGGPPLHGGPRALRRRSSEVSARQALDARAVRVRHEQQIRGDHPGRQRSGRHDLAARRVGTDRRRRSSRPRTAASRRGRTTSPLRQNCQAPLQLMAEQTGGIAAVNTNDWKKSLDELAADFSNFYSLGYRTTRAAVDRPHSIEVNVKRKGLKSAPARASSRRRSRRGRPRPSWRASTIPRDDNPLNIALSVGEPKPYDADNFDMPVAHLGPDREARAAPGRGQLRGQRSSSTSSARDSARSSPTSRSRDRS